MEIWVGVQVTERVATAAGKWHGWNWKSEGDLPLMSAYLIVFVWIALCVQWPLHIYQCAYVVKTFGFWALTINMILADICLTINLVVQCFIQFLTEKCSWNSCLWIFGFEHVWNLGLVIMIFFCSNMDLIIAALWLSAWQEWSQVEWDEICNQLVLNRYVT